MEQIVAIVLPVFGLIGIGYAMAWTRLLDHCVGQIALERPVEHSINLSRQPPGDAPVASFLSFCFE